MATPQAVPDDVWRLIGRTMSTVDASRAARTSVQLHRVMSPLTGRRLSALGCITRHGLNAIMLKMTMVLRQTVRVMHLLYTDDMTPERARRAGWGCMQAGGVHKQFNISNKCRLDIMAVKSISNYGPVAHVCKDAEIIATLARSTHGNMVKISRVPKKRTMWHRIIEKSLLVV